MPIIAEPRVVPTHHTTLLTEEMRLGGSAVTNFPRLVFDARRSEQLFARTQEPVISAVTPSPHFLSCTYDMISSDKLPSAKRPFVSYQREYLPI